MGPTPLSRPPSAGGRRYRQRRELEHLHETRHETFLHGSEDALEAHTKRMFEMEQEYLRRFPDRVTPDPARVRATHHS